MSKEEIRSYPHTVQIQCPRCDLVQQAAIHFYAADPFPSLVHTCITCGYVIMESEWEEVG